MLIIGLCAGFVASALLCVRAIMRVAGFVTWEKLPTFALNRALPNPGDRDTEWDYVDRRAWADLASAKMWGALAAICLVGALLAGLAFA